MKTKKLTLIKHVENYIFIMNIHTNHKECFHCKKKKDIRKLSVREKKKKQVNNCVKVTNIDASAGRNIRTFLLEKIQILNYYWIADLT